MRPDLKSRLLEILLVFACTFLLVIVLLAIVDDSDAAEPKRTGIEIGTKDNGLHVCEERYLATYAEAAEKLGSQALGANLVDDGVLDGTRPPVSNRRACAEAEQIYATEAAAPAPAYSGEAGARCVGMEAESGAAGYDAYNPDGGYIGCYQIAPFHYSSGVCTGLDTSPAGQDACAAAICGSQGAGAWTNAAGANPC